MNEKKIEEINEEKIEEKTYQKTETKMTRSLWMGYSVFVVAMIVILGLMVGYIGQVFTGWKGDITARLIVELVMFVMALVWGTKSISSSIKKWKGIK